MPFFSCILQAVASGWSWMTCPISVFYEGAAIRQHLMLPAWVGKATRITGQGVNHPAGQRHDTAGRIKWETVNKGDIPVLFVHYKPGSPWIWMTQPRLNSPQMGDVSSAGKGAGKSHCPGDLPCNTHSRQEEQEDQSLGWGGEKWRRKGTKKWNCPLWHTHRPGELSGGHGG